MEVYDPEGKPMGLQFAKKLQLDAEKYECLKASCGIKDGLKYDEVVAEAKKVNGKTDAMLKVQDEFNEKYESILARFWKSH